MSKKSLIISFFGLLIILNSQQVWAASPAISHSYIANGPIYSGSLVSLDPKHGNVVDPANNSNSKRLIGVAVANGRSLLAIDSSSSTIQVATSGTVDALVTTINGNVKVGNQISVSPFNGIGVKAMSGLNVIGLAETSLSNSTSGITKLTAVDKQGKDQSIGVGYVKVEISVGAGDDSASNGGAQINSLQKLIKGFTGKTVPTARVVSSLAIAFVALLSLVVLIYSSIYGSVIAIGRNPLAKHVLFRALGIIFGLVVVLAGIAGTAIYFLLH
jgi:hypothetical protein